MIICDFRSLIYWIFGRKVEVWVNLNVLGVEYVMKNGKAMVITMAIDLTKLVKDKNGNV